MFTITIVATAFSLAVGLLAGERPLASSKADDVIRKHIWARGGRKNLRDIKDMKAMGYLETQGFEVDIVVWMQRPNRSRMDMSIQGQDIVQAYDGQTAWWVNPLLGAVEPQTMPEEFAKTMLRWVDFDGPLIDYRQKHNKVDYVTKIDLKGSPTHMLNVKLADGDVWNIYIDAETYLEVARTFEQTFRGATSAVTTYFSGFKEIDGVVTPTVVEGIGFTGTPFRMVFESFEPNQGIEEKRFMMPGGSK